jgi:hypothetical protein
MNKIDERTIMLILVLVWAFAIGVIGFAMILS